MDEMMPIVPTVAAEKLLEDLAEALDIPETRYAAAERSYRSIGNWLDRPGSVFADVETKVYPQGSFQLGTVIRPATDAEDYDLDLVCEVDIAKVNVTQEKLKNLLGEEIKAYTKAHSMQEPEPTRRCWTLNYADEAQFHMDVLPAVPDGIRQQRLIQASGERGEWTNLALAITDIKHPLYRDLTEDWPASNPKGYAEWFRSCMRAIFEARRLAMALKEARTRVEEIPEYKIKTPLQSAIQILKRHRDMRFVENPDDRPISIILTTLAARAYSQETTISGALFNILGKMDQYIEDRRGVAWVRNPTDSRENFADKWVEHPQRQAAFYEWLQTARAEFGKAAGLTSLDQIVEALGPRMGHRLIETAAAKRLPKGSVSLVRERTSRTLQRILSAPHRKPLMWPELARGSVAIRSAIVNRPGFRPRILVNDAPALAKHCDLTFEAVTDIPRPYMVYWQVVNTGDDARRDNGLRGGFDEGIVERGKLIRHESTRYTGSHSMECFVVKDNYCVARSGLFIVNIK